MQLKRKLSALEQHSRIFHSGIFESQNAVLPQAAKLLLEGVVNHNAVRHVSQIAGSSTQADSAFDTYV